MILGELVGAILFVLILFVIGIVFITAISGIGEGVSEMIRKIWRYMN